MAHYDSQVIKMICDADFIGKNDWTKKFMSKTIDEMIIRYQSTDEYRYGITNK